MCVELDGLKTLMGGKNFITVIPFLSIYSRKFSMVIVISIFLKVVEHKTRKMHWCI